MKAELLEEPTALTPTPLLVGLEGVNAVAPARGTFGSFRGCFWLSLLGGVAIFAFSGSRPGMLPDILQHAGQFPVTKNDPVPNISSTWVQCLLHGPESAPLLLWAELCPIKIRMLKS